MKNLLIALIFFAFTVNANSQTSTEWKWMHPRPQAQYLRWCKLVDANTWYAVGEYGMFMKSTNGGTNWTTKTAGYPSTLYPGAGIYQNNLTAFFLNSSTGYIGVQAVPGIVRTTNGGLSFDTLRILASGSGTVNGLYFINSTTGYLCGTSTYKVMKTTDAGTTWAIAGNIASLGSLTFYSVYASDTNNIKVTSSSGNVYLTTDAGLNWVGSNVGTTSTINLCKFSNSNTGYVCGSSGLVRYTTNGGVNWSGVNPGTTSTLYNIVIEGSDVYVSGFSSTQDVYKSTDFGNTWTNINYGYAASITGFNAYGFDKNASNMMVVGTYGEMIRSTNGGTNWANLMYRKSLANFSGEVYASSGSGTVIAVGVNLGSNDAILSSQDGGNSWNTPNFAINSYCSSISMLNPNTGWVSGRYGLLFKTTNGGQTWDTTLAWNPVLVPYFGNGIDMVNANTGWIVGGIPGVGGVTKIFKTTNGGINWVEQVSAYTGPVGVKVDMVDVNTGYMSHGAGLQKTTNGGDNWVNIVYPAPVSGVSFTPVKAVDANTVFTGGTNSQVYGTTNGGTTWDSLNFPVKAGTIFNTDWYDSQNGVACAVIGVLGRTTNRGQSWQMYNIGTYTIYDVAMVHPDTIYAINGNSFGAMVLKFSKGTATGGFTYEHTVPSDYTLSQNYPNPFNPVTTIEFNLPKAGNVSLKVFDIAGREYSTEIRNLSLNPGNYKMNFNGAELSSGVYFYSLNIDGINKVTKKMMLIK
jgi:photosystem II stability/assembly factor-like uncharacterized protein